MSKEIDQWNWMKITAKDIAERGALTSRREAQTSHAKLDAASPNNRLNLDLESVSRGMTADPLISPNRG